MDVRPNQRSKAPLSNFSGALVHVLRLLVQVTDSNFYRTKKMPALHHGYSSTAHGHTWNKRLVIAGRYCCFDSLLVLKSSSLE